VDVDEYFELEDGIVREVSAVDIPAVPDAQILTASKARAATVRKRVADHLGNRDAFIEEMLERGHDEAAAERVWDVLDRAVNVEGAGEPGANKSLTDAAKAFLNSIADGASALSSSTATAKDADGEEAEKEGRTLSQSNQDSAMAAVDANLDILEDAGVDHDMERFTDRDDCEFDLSEHDAQEWAVADPDVQTAKNAPEGDTSDDETTMSDDEPPEWANDLIEQTKENAERLDEIQSGDAEKDEDDPLEDAPEWAKEVVEQTEKNAERIDAISKQTGATQSQQLGGAEQSGAEGGVDKRAAFFTPQSKQHLLAEQAGGEN